MAARQREVSRPSQLALLLPPALVLRDLHELPGVVQGGNAGLASCGLEGAVGSAPDEAVAVFNITAFVEVADPLEVELPARPFPFRVGDGGLLDGNDACRHEVCSCFSDQHIITCANDAHVLMRDGVKESSPKRAARDFVVR